MILGDQTDAIVARCRRGYGLSYVQADAHEYSESCVNIQFYEIWRLGMIRLGHTEFSSVSQDSWAHQERRTTFCLRFPREQLPLCARVLPFV